MYTLSRHIRVNISDIHIVETNNKNNPRITVRAGRLTNKLINIYNPPGSSCLANTQSRRRPPIRNFNGIFNNRRGIPSICLRSTKRRRPYKKLFYQLHNKFRKQSEVSKYKNMVERRHTETTWGTLAYKPTVKNWKLFHKTLKQDKKQKLLLPEKCLEKPSRATNIYKQNGQLQMSILKG